MLVNLDSFDKLKTIFITACKQNNILQHTIDGFLEFLESNKEFLVESGQDNIGSANPSLIEFFEDSKRFELFIVQFFKEIRQNDEL